ncbi:MAG: AAA family ATPase, partial [Myxococcota bacterium]
TPTLDEVAQPLHALVKAGSIPRAFERDADVQRLLDLLGGRTGPVVVLGPRGVGKSAVLDELAVRLCAADAPLARRGRPAWFLDASRLVAGEGYFGDWQRQVLDVLRELVVSESTWFLGAVLPLLDAGKSAHSQANVAQMLGPAFATRDLSVVAESTEADWAQVQLRNPGFAALFVPVRLEEPAPEATRRVVDRVADASGLAIDPGARRAVGDLARRYGRRDSWLGSSVGLLRRLVAAVTAEGGGSVDRFRVVRHVCEETGLPAFLVRDDLPLDREALRDRFAARILGQPAVVEQMADLVVRIKAGLADDGRPLGAFLFLGPTGVGKTETVKALAEVLYGRADRILRFDMSEFAGSDALDRLIGHGPSHGLVGRVAQSPFAVVLLDEVEKAHPAVFDLLLQVLGEARLSDRAGRVADFRNTIVLMTSNLGVGTFRRPTGFGADPQAALRDHLLGEVRRFFRPELVGRLDEVVAFAPLGAEPVAALTQRELDGVRKREGFVGRGIGLQLEPGVPEWLAARGVDLRYGARPLKRAVERELVAPIARALSERPEPPRGVVVSCGEAGLVARPTGDASVATPRDEGLRAALDQLAHLRYGLRRWATVPPFRAAAHHLRLVDRLADTGAFWRDEEAARARLSSVVPGRAVTEAHAALVDQVEALEDLALEAWAGWGASSDDLEAEIAAAARAFDDLEWAIAGLDRDVRDEVTLWFFGTGQDTYWMEGLVVAYAKIAFGRGWSVHLAARRAHDPEVVENIDRSWLDAEPHCWNSAPGPLADEDALRKHLRARLSGHKVLELRITGRHAATMLAGEEGVHAVDGPSGPRDLRVAVALRADESMVDRIRRLRPPYAVTRQRQVLVKSDRLRDYVLGRQSGIGRLEERLAALLRDRMLARLWT